MYTGSLIEKLIASVEQAEHRANAMMFEAMAGKTAPGKTIKGKNRYLTTGSVPRASHMPFFKSAASAGVA